MEIYLIRHTTPDIEKGVCYGQSDLDLVSTYNDEFNAVKSKLQNFKNYQVFSSPLKRCALLAKAFSKTVVFDNRLKELDFGDWELRAWHDISEDEINPWMEDFVNVVVPNGESYMQLASRVTSYLEEIIHSTNNQNLIIVSHAGPIRVILASIMNIHLKDSFKIKVNYGDAFHLKKTNGKLKLITEINL
ncbi:alpha-ribazole phosphatase [Tamlana sp. 2201CG12-4]|uniref:alpha-ribazole phosphatase n=1 Tax=Tamlana sp. 2201CG12-4 TaxID=3112582 RepID=UPI002DBAC61F|nr:alpha-ribazole phosphatase [Tamlana sp. 2201CG12-4]MEC3908379.1 alpha-ribazole phosphatase [Tamlana sp. 2201CG12-4]